MNRLVLGVMCVLAGVALFSCEIVPEAPQLYQPLDGADIVHPTFVWEAAGDEYELHLSTDSTFATIEDTWSGLRDTTFAPPDTLDEGTYFWRVRAYDNYWSEWSEIRSFTIELTYNVF